MRNKFSVIIFYVLVALFIKQLQFTGGNSQTETQSFTLRQIINGKVYDIEISTEDTVNG